VNGYLISGCTAVSKDEIFSSLNQKTKALGAKDIKYNSDAEDAKAIDKVVQELLLKPLNEDGAIQIALINNRGLQQTYERIGLAQADLIDAGSIKNPLFGYSLGYGGGIAKGILSLELAFLDAIWIPLKKEISGVALEEAKYSVGDEVLRVVRDTKKRFAELKSADESVKLYVELLKSYEISLQLASRQYAAGTASKRDMLKIQSEYQSAKIETIKINKERAIAREELNRMLGLYATQTSYRLDDNNPIMLSPLNITLGDLEKIAIDNRLDLAAAKKAVEYGAKDMGYTEDSRFLHDADVTFEKEKSKDSPDFNTFGIKIPIPIFDTKSGEITRAKSKYNQSVHRLYELAINIRSQVREDYAKLKYAQDIANEYDSGIKTNEDVLRETQLFYNGMLDGIYELLAAQRGLVKAKIEALSSVAEYNKARADLVYTSGKDFTRK